MTKITTADFRPLRTNPLNNVEDISRPGMTRNHQILDAREPDDLENMQADLDWYIARNMPGNGRRLFVAVFTIEE